MKTTIVRVWLLGTLYILEEIHLFKFERLQSVNHGPSKHMILTTSQTCWQICMSV